MSEALTTPTANAATLYPADGGAAAAAADLAARGGDTTAATAGADTTAAAAGADTLSGQDTGTDTTAAGSGADTLAGAAGNDSTAAPEYTFTLPEGFTEDATLQSEAATVFAAAGVPADKAQGLIDLFGKAVKASNDKAAATYTTQQNAWLTEVNAMPEFQGPTRETSLQSIAKLFDEYGTPEARAALNIQGIGNNPALVKMMLKVAGALSEGTPATAGRPAGNGRGGAKTPTTVGQSLYPDAT